MMKSQRFLTTTIILFCSIATASAIPLAFHELKCRVAAAPKMISQEDTKKIVHNSIISKAEFMEVYTNYAQTVDFSQDNNNISSSQSDPVCWINGTVFHQKSSQSVQNNETFYAAKVSVEPGDRVAFHGDLHGDIHSLLAMIESLQEAQIMDSFAIKHDVKNNFYIIF